MYQIILNFLETVGLSRLDGGQWEEEEEEEKQTKKSITVERPEPRPQ